MEGDIFQTYGGRRINVSICNVLHSYFKNEDTFEQRYLEMIVHRGRGTGEAGEARASPEFRGFTTEKFLAS